MAPLDEKTKKRFLECVAKGYWWEVREIYMEYPESQELKISKSGDTAIHIAIAWKLEYAVGSIVLFAGRNALAISNEQGNTPLHLAASLGRSYICQCIAEKDSKLIVACNKNGETPLFLAVTHGRTHAFLCLQHFCKEEGYEYAYYTRKNGDTILHSAISEEHFDIACYIIHQYPKLVYMENNDGLSPLHLLASKPSAFHSGIHLIGLRKLVYNCICIGNLAHISNIEKEVLDDVRVKVGDWKKNHQCLLDEAAANVQVDHSKNHQQDDEIANKQGNQPRSEIIVDRGENHQLDEEAANGQGNQPGYETIVDHWENNQQDEEAANEQVDCWENHQQDEEAANEREHEGRMIFRAKDHLRDRMIFRAKYHLLLLDVIICLLDAVKLIFKLMMCVFKLVRFIVGYEHYLQLRHIKERCRWSVEVMNELIKYNSEYAYEQPGMHQYLADISSVATTKTETALLVAAKHGVVEMVKGILEVYPGAIFDVNTKKKNIVMLAVEHRQTHLYEFLLQEYSYHTAIFGQVDNEGNTVLHIAANLSKDQQPWRIRGAALEMYMEVKWYKFVKHSMPPGFFARYNDRHQTPGQIFKDTHGKLIDEGRQWLTSYSNSASLVSALIATVAFPTSATFPGGVQQDSGSPTLKDEPIFIVSAISSLIALCFSMIALVMFMVIPTSGFRMRDFRKDLPLKLLVGLISLFMSILSMLVSFCAGHFFVLKDKLKNGAIPVYALCCLPLVVFITAQFLLDFEMVWITLKKDPQHQQRK